MQQIYKRAFGLMLFSLLYAVSLKAQLISTFAGNGTAGNLGSGGLATSANLFFPSGVALDTANNVFIADTYNHSIKKVSSATGIITTIAGTGISGFSGDGGLATSATLNRPSSVAIDKQGNVYIADAANNRIRKITATTGIISTIAGTGSFGFSGDGGLATSARMIYPYGVTIDTAGNLYIADQFNNRVRKVNTSTGIISTVAGNGSPTYNGDGISATTAGLNMPCGIAVDKFGNLYIADNGNFRVRKVTLTTGIISTVVGNGLSGYNGEGLAATDARLNSVSRVAIDSSGNIYLSDSAIHRVRKVIANTGILNTIAGDGVGTFKGDNGDAISASLFNPTGLAVTAIGEVYIADVVNNRIRRVGPITLPLNLLTFTAKQQSTSINLIWQTINEVNTSHFTIQCSVDGTNFSEIGKVAAKGDGNYSFTDNQLPSATVVYYRLQMVDKDGSFAYSKVVSCKLTDASKTLAVYPNPVKDHLFVQITSTKAEKITLQVTDLQGKLLQQEDTQVAVGNVSLSVNTSTLAKGSYILLVKGSSGVQQKQFVKD